MTPEEIAALVAKSVADAMAKLNADKAAAEKAAADKVAADKAAADKAAADKAAADKAAADKGTPQVSTDPVVNAQLAEMRRAREEDKKRLDALQKDRDDANAKAEKAERATALNTALADFGFRSPSARETALSLLTPHIKRNEAGQLVAGDNLTVEAFAKDFIPKSHDYLLAPVGGGGAGVVPGASFIGQKVADLNDIKAGMTPETRAAVIAAMQNAASEANR
ncbi:hypothetical protein [uncultured Paludibaculum sp.]|uniref:hypothetical protein n=1 Tax=uncultured Paludibaculum sp. TaxID=1765020 RepID=UPI002AABC751|nr:hypothetical protein [uncultured Paludibaculum sp.]